MIEVDESGVLSGIELLLLVWLVVILFVVLIVW